MSNLVALESFETEHIASQKEIQEAASDPYCLPGLYPVKFKNITDGVMPEVNQEGQPTKYPGSYWLTGDVYVGETPVVLRRVRMTPENLDNGKMKAFLLWSNFLTAHDLTCTTKGDIQDVVEYLEETGCVWRIGLIGLKEGSDDVAFCKDQQTADEAIKAGFTLMNYLDKKPKSVRRLSN